MAKYTYSCSCGEKKVSYGSFGSRIKCKCGLDMVTQLPSLNNTTVTETVDKMSGKNWMKDQKEVITNRSEDYFWSVEVPRFVESGIYSMETMLERQWVYYDDKGNLKTRTKPPRKG